MEFIKRNKSIVIGALIGLVAGYLYWYFIGCNTGTCAITSSPVNSSIYALLAGGVLGSNFKSGKGSKEEPSGQ